MNKLLIPLCVCTLASGSVFADSKINGEAKISVDAGQVSNIVDGSGNEAYGYIGSLKNATISGKVVIDVDTNGKSIVNRATGAGTKAIMRVATIDDSRVSGSAKINVTTGSIHNIVSGSGNAANVNIGSMSGSRAGSLEIDIVLGDVVNSASGSGNYADFSIGTIR